MRSVFDAPLLPAYTYGARVAFVEGDGVWLVDPDGRRYLDFMTGVAVVSLGHRHPAPLTAAHAQLDRLWHISNFFASEPAAELARRLNSRFRESHLFFCNSGAEANESALKYARKKTGKPGAISLHGAFHGRTMGALSLTGQPAKRDPFEPLLPGFAKAHPNDISSLRAAAHADVGLILLEPVLGEGGVIPLEQSFVEAAAELAEELGALLAFDEVQTGVGRTGSFFAHEVFGVRPHMVTMGKALGNGLPIAALLVADEVAGGFVPGDHGTTFGGNLVTCAAACAVLDSIDDQLLENARDMGELLADGLRGLPGVREVRGRGLMLGAVLERPAQAVVDAALDEGLVCTMAGPDILRLLPPLVITEDDALHALRILRKIMIA